MPAEAGAHIAPPPFAFQEPQFEPQKGAIMSKTSMLAVGSAVGGALVVGAVVMAFMAGESVQQQRGLVLQVRDLEQTVNRLEANNAQLRESMAAATGSVSSLPAYVSDQVRQYGVDVQQASYGSTSSYVPEPLRSCFHMNLGSNVRVRVCESR